MKIFKFMVERKWNLGSVYLSWEMDGRTDEWREVVDLGKRDCLQPHLASQGVFMRTVMCCESKVICIRFE